VLDDLGVAFHRVLRWLIRTFPKWAGTPAPSSADRVRAIAWPATVESRSPDRDGPGVSIELGSFGFGERARPGRNERPMAWVRLTMRTPDAPGRRGSRSFAAGVRHPASGFVWKATQLGSFGWVRSDSGPLAAWRLRSGLGSFGFPRASGSFGTGLSSRCHGPRRRCR
jgi:hypothetical protein